MNRNKTSTSKLPEIGENNFKGTKLTSEPNRAYTSKTHNHFNENKTGTNTSEIGTNPSEIGTNPSEIGTNPSKIVILVITLLK